MKIFKYSILLFLMCFFTLLSSSENNIYYNLILKAISIPKTYSNNAVDYQTVYDTINIKSHIRIGNDSAIVNFYHKLDSLKQGKIDSVVIFHFGDSHIKGKFFTNTIKQEFDKDYDGIKYETFGLDGASFRTFCNKTEYLDIIKK